MRRVAVVGATGKMGTLACRAIGDADDLELTAVVSRRAPEHATAPHSTRLEDVDASAYDVVVDLSAAEAARATLAVVAANGRAAVIGTSGLGDEDLELARSKGATRVLVVPNFSIGAVLSMRFAAAAAPHFVSAEVVEVHHDEKRDAPSATAIATARAIAAAREAHGLQDVPDPTERLVVEGARGAEVAGGVRVHSLRLRGPIASQEVRFGAPGEGLVVRHDTYDRESFMAGLLLAVRKIDEIEGVEVGLDRLLP